MTDENRSGEPISPETGVPPSGWGIVRQNENSGAQVSTADKALCQLASRWDRKKKYEAAVSHGHIAIRITTRSSGAHSILLFETPSHYRAYMEGVLDVLDGGGTWAWEKGRKS